MSAALAYCAGIIDGEGYIEIKRDEPRRDRKTPSFHARVTVRMVQREAVDFLASTLGGNVRPHAASRENGRPLVSWNVTDAHAERVLRAVLPYLRVKRANAEVVLALRALQAEGRRRHLTKVIGHREFVNAYGTVRLVETRVYSDDFIEACSNLWRRVKQLNARGLESLEEVKP